MNTVISNFISHAFRIHFACTVNFEALIWRASKFTVHKNISGYVTVDLTISIMLICCVTSLPVMIIYCSQGLADSTVVAKVNGVLWDLDRPFEEDSELKLLKFTDEEGEYVFRHSTAHMLGKFSGYVAASISMLH